MRMKKTDLGPILCPLTAMSKIAWIELIFFLFFFQLKLLDNFFYHLRGNPKSACQLSNLAALWPPLLCMYGTATKANTG